VNSRRILGCLGVVTALAAAACSRPYAMDRPHAFREYTESHDLRLITADGIMLKVRKTDNYPKATLGFWADAMNTHLQEQGYAAKSKQCFKTASGLDGCTLDFLVPHGAQDWVLSETLFVVDDDIYLVEVAGPYDRYAKIERQLAQSYKTFRMAH
jgi:hypothetical protein